MSVSFVSATAPHSLASLLYPVICAGLLLIAAARDVASRTIPNFIPVLLFLLGVALQLNAAALPTALLAAGLVFVAAALAWRVGLMGGGDVKLLAALALCVPPAAVLSLVMATGLAGGVLGLLYLALRRVPRFSCSVRREPTLRPLPARVLRAEWWRIGRGSPLPYGVAIAAGGLITLF